MCCDKSLLVNLQGKRIVTSLKGTKKLSDKGKINQNRL